ncbi:hypothetical protein DBR06_SOUSAS1010010, partial [Sousa chinensis]
DGGQNASTGQDSESRGGEEDDQCRDKVHQFSCGHVCAGELKYWTDITEEMIDDIGATEAEARDEVDLSQGDAKAIGTGTKRQEEAEPMAHNGGAVQWAAGGHITVTGHGSQEHTF